MPNLDSHMRWLPQRRHDAPPRPGAAEGEVLPDEGGLAVEGAAVAHVLHAAVVVVARNAEVRGPEAEEHGD